MTEQSSRELDNGVFTSAFKESGDFSNHSSVTGVDSKCLSSIGEVSGSGVTSALDRAVAALESGTNNILEHSMPSENVTPFLPCELELDNQAAKQEYLPQRLTNEQEDDDQMTKIRDFSELRAMFSEAGAKELIKSPRLGKKAINLSTGKKENLELEGVDSDACNGMPSEGESIVARMKRSFETTGNSSEDASFENRNYKHIKPVSFEVGLDRCVTRESSATYDSLRTDQTNKKMSDNNLSEHIFRNEPSINSMPDSTDPETLEAKKQHFNEEEISANTTNPSDNPKNISFDISFDERLSKRILPKTMPKPLRGKLDIKTTEACANENEAVRPVEREEILENQGESKVLPISDSDLAKTCYSFEVSFEQDSPKKLNSRDRLNKLLSKKPRTDRPPGGKVTETRDNNNLLTVEHNENTQYSTVTLEPRLSSPQEQALHESAGKSTFDVGFERDSTPETTKEPYLASKITENDERDEVKRKTQGISFDICFGENSDEKPKINRKSKLTAKHIRLKMTKSKQQQQNHQNKIENDESTNVSSSIMPRLLAKTGKNANERNTYTLDEVSNSLQSACERGLTLEDALDDLAKKEEPKEPISGVMTVGSSVRDDVVPTKRGTYSLDAVETCLVSAADQGLTVADALDNLADSEEKVVEPTTQNNEQESSMINAGSTSLNRGSYDFIDNSKTIDKEKDKGSSLEEALIQLLGEVESVVKETQKKGNRGTYNLNDVSEAVQEASDRGVSVEKTLKNISQTDKNNINNKNMQKTSRTDKSKNISTEENFVDFGNLNSQSEPSVGNRGTYPLEDVEKHLDLSADKGNSIVDALSDISKPKPEEASALTKVNSNESSKLEGTDPTRNTYTLDEVAESLELAKSKGIPIVEALSSISSEKHTKELETPGSRGTYTLDEVAQSLETAREKGLPVVMALENLGLYGGGSVKGPSEAAVHRRQGKLTNRKTYALASPLETIGEEKQLRLFDGASRKLLPATQASSTQDPQTVLYDDPENLPPSGQNVVQTLDLLTSACEALLKTTAKKGKPEEERPGEPQVLSEESRDLRQQFKAESRDSGISFPSGPSERGTYSLDDVSESLEGAAKKGIPVIEALGSLTVKEPVKKYRIPRALRKAGSKSESSLIKATAARDDTSRQTYSLDNVSNSMEDATAKGIPVIAALDELTNSLAKFSATRPTPGKPLKKPDRPSIIRKKEAARKERANVKSELAREVPKQSSMPFPISYPPAMRNSYSLDDVASAFEKAYQTGVPFQNVLEDMYSGNNEVTVQPREDGDITRSAGSLRMEKYDLQSTKSGEEYARKSQSVSSLRKTSDPGVSDSLLDGKFSTPPRKSSTSSEGSLTYSSSYGSDVSMNRDSSSTEELPHISKVSSVRKQRRQSSGPFQLKKGNRRNSPANLRKHSTSSSSLQGDSVESLTSRDSETSDSTQLKRGTYDLKKVGEELDSFRIQGIPVVKGLDKITTEVSFSSKAQSKAAEVTPKRGTYSLEDVSRQLDNEKCKGDSVIQALDKVSSNPELSSMSSLDGREIHRDSQSAGNLTQPNMSENKTRNTFTLEHVGVSIADAASRGVPIVEALANLSHGGSPANPDNTADKLDYRPDRELKEHRPQQDPFSIEYFPSKAKKALNFRVENEAQAVEVGDKQESKHEDLDNYPTKNGNVIVESQKSDSKSEYSQLFEHSNLAEKTSIQNESAEKPSKRQMLKDQKDDKALLAGSSEQTSSVSPSRSKWQRSGSYIEALESFEEMLAVDQCVSSEGLDSVPVKESNYVNGNYDKMYPENAGEMTETTPRGRSTWRPSATILDKILNLMDDHEEQGLSIADALEKAAELSERQGEPYNSKINDAKREDETWCSEKQKAPEREDLGHEGTKVPESNGTVSCNDFGNQGDQAGSSNLTFDTNQQDKAPQDKVPFQQDFVSNGLREFAPPRHFWKVDSAKLPPSVVEFASGLPSDVGSQGQLADNEVNEDSSSKKAFSIFIGDENDQTKEQGLTPEQQKKRDRFLKNRQKKMEEEKARREAEIEKKKQQQEIEVPKRVRQLSQATEEHTSRHTIREYKSPPRIIKSSGKSNRKMISNALCHACLSGAVNNDNRERCLQAMSESQGSHFIILLKDGLRFRGLFMYSPENEQAYKVYGTGPKIISTNMVDCVYKYSSGSKEFVKIPSKSLSISVDGVAINKVYWQSNKPNVLSKTQSNLKRPPRPPQR